MKKLWGGRFAEQTNPAVEAFHSSVAFDARLTEQDITGSLAHAKMLCAVGLLSESEYVAIRDGLQGILADFRAGTFALDPAAEDVHMNVEAELTRRIGPTAGKLHTARSRNDQVSLDLRLFLYEACGVVREHLDGFLTELCGLASKHLDTAMPGYTHLQRAQPITLAHHLMAWAQMLRRDRMAFDRLSGEVNISPLGSGALAGTTFAIDRAMVADELGMAGITQNSLDGVADRDGACDFLYHCARCMAHVSRMCEEIILWNTAEFGFITLSDAYATGSSMMPQKKNPDVAELARGKTGRVYGDLIALLTVIKGLPLAYNKDMQEDKEAVFDAYDTLTAVLGLMPPMLATATFNAERMQAAALGGFSNATDLADYVAAKGVPFRQAHEVSGKLVALCLGRGCTLMELSMDDFKVACDVIEEDIYEAISLKQCLSHRSLPGGPAPREVERQVAEMLKSIGKV